MKKTLIKNRAPAPVQITAEQLLREAQDRQEETHRPIRRRITDQEELDDYRLTKRKDFEDQIRRQRQHIGTWIKYAEWEASQGQFRRARSVYERALDVDYKTPSLWLKYAEMEMSNKNINHARNIWDRAVTLLPRISQFWYKYAYMEEVMGNIENARQIFTRWMEWKPDETAWHSYIKFEKRQKADDHVRKVYEQFIQCHANVKAYVKYAKWEEKSKRIDLARKIYERALMTLPKYKIDDEYYILFAKFEERCKEYERAKMVYQYALNQFETEHDRKNQSALYGAFIDFEKRYGDHESAALTLLKKKRTQYQQALETKPSDYDTWFLYIQCEEEHLRNSIKSDSTYNETLQAQHDLLREIYERAISQIPTSSEKAAWKRYIYLWIKYALFEELEANDMERANDVYRACLDILPQKQFTFSKIWILFAEFKIRQYDLPAARSILGHAIGQNPRHKLFKYYIGLERMLGEIQRCRLLYEKYLLFDSSATRTWVEYAKMEYSVNEYERCRSIYELATEEESVQLPEVIWKSYIDFEVAHHHVERVRSLYERLLQHTRHLMVWLGYARYEISIQKDSNDAQQVDRVRSVFDRAYEYFKVEKMNAERAEIVSAWKDYEESHETGDVSRLQNKIPQKVVKTRPVYDNENNQIDTEEYTDYVFPDDKKSKTSLQLLSAAAEWKKGKKQEVRAS